MTLNEILKNAVCEKMHSETDKESGVTVSSKHNKHHDQNCGLDVYRFSIRLETAFTLRDSDRLMYSDIYDIKRHECAENIYRFIMKDIFDEIEKIMIYASDATIPDQYKNLPPDLRKMYMNEDKIHGIINMCSKLISRGV